MTVSREHLAIGQNDEQKESKKYKCAPARFRILRDIIFFLIYETVKERRTSTGNP
jgi:hypothetical protein